MRKLNKKQVQQQARSIILSLIDRELRSQSDILTWEDLPDLDEEGFEQTWSDVYDEMRRIHQQLRDRWNIE